MTEVNLFDNENPVLRQHQSDALASIQSVIDAGEGKGRVVLPTGTGKTRIEVEAVCRIIEKNIKDGKYGGVHVVLSPRILLAYQQLDEFLKIMTKGGTFCDYMVVNSGGLNSKQYEEKLLAMGVDNPEEIESTTRIDDISATMQTAKNTNKRPLVIFSTYHSVERVKTASKNSAIEICSYILDEAQYCVTSGSFRDVLEYDSSFKFFFTATEKWTDDEEEGLGMNVESKFGKLLFTEKPRTLIERGEMASVAIHEVKVSDDVEIKKNEWDSMAKAVIDSFDKHREVLKKHSFEPDTIGPKMIVVCNKQFSLKGIMRSQVMKNYKLARPNVKICALSSDFGIEIEGISKPRANNREKEFLLAKMRSWKPSDEAITFHVDMIGEGIDVPGITAIMPFRNFGKIKFLQNLGRGTRLIAADRERLYSEEILPADLKPAQSGGKYIKPYCWLVLPVLSSDYVDMKKRYMEYILALRSDYGFDTSELVVLDNVYGGEKIPPKEQKKDKGLIYGLIHEIEKIEEEEKISDAIFELNTMSDEEKAELFMAL